MYRIYFDEDKNILRLKLEGFWDIDIASRFSTDLMRKVGDVSRGGRVISILSDGSALPVQPVEVTEAFATLMLKISPLVRGRIAIITAGALNRLQAQRIFTDKRYRVFDDSKAGEDWLAEAAQ
jgi:hypothetical protein